MEDMVCMSDGEGMMIFLVKVVRENVIRLCISLLSFFYFFVFCLNEVVIRVKVM